MSQIDNTIFIDAEENGGSSDDVVQTGLLRMLAFKLGDESYCINLSSSKELIRIDSLTKVPNTPAFIMGVINLRGEIISVLDVRGFLNQQTPDKIGDQMVFITDVTDANVGVVIDDLMGVIDVEEKNIQPPISTINKEQSAFTKGQVEVNGNIFIVLDIYQILKSDSVNNLEKGE